jgi:hypothetical protein
MLRDVYAQKALSQVPRLLSCQDRNPFSPTYGCCDREFWLCRSTDFPNSILQFGLHARALAWAHEMPGNIYYQQDKILGWTLAGIDYWMSIQKSDGSFDEFYPNERGWAGPTGFLLYAMIDSYRLFGDAFPDTMKGRFFETCEKAGRFLAIHDEPGVLANHHAMAVLPVFEAARLLDSHELWNGYETRLKEFYSHCHPEGWCLEYDGADPGYLSATVSFLGKIYKHRETVERVSDDPKMREIMLRAVDFCANFVYPNGHYAGTAGSRQTLHFYPHGFEILAPEYPLAASVADRLLEGLRDGALVPPEIQADRYFQYRVPEFLLSWVDYGERPYGGITQRPPLPCEGEPFDRHYPEGHFHVRKTDRSYTVINMAKGGVIKHFDLVWNKLVFNDCGITAELDDNRIVTSQWIDPEYGIDVQPTTVTVQGQCRLVPTKVFNPVKFILFRIFMVMVGWHTGTAYRIKGWIRKLLMTHASPVPLKFKREISWDEEDVRVTDTLELLDGSQVVRLQLGDELPIRYVPQSRYFQPQELDVSGVMLSPDQLRALNSTGKLVVERSSRA